MKVNKKLVVIFLSALIGLSVSGGIGGAFAWYQYNSQVTASFIGSSVADSSVLQIGHLDGSNMVWERDFVHQNQDLVPVTFGQLATVGGKANCLPGSAYGYPEAGKQVNDGYSAWSVVAPNQGYAQFDIYLRAFNANKAAIARDVYLSDITIDSPAEADTESHKLVSEAIRIHLAVEGNVDPNRLISKTAITSESPLNLYGPLDLDDDGENDTVGGYAFNQGRGTEIVYGRNGETQVTTAKADLIQARDSNGAMPAKSASTKCICTTKESSTEFTKITVTVWIEGWAMLGGAKRGQNDEIVMSNLWDPTLSAGFNVNVGMTFDTGKMI